MFKVSQSKIKTWRRCRQAFDYRYNQNLRKKVIKRPLAFGTLVHRMLDESANKRDPFKVLDNLSLKELKLFKEEEAEYGNLIQTVRDVMATYFEYWRNRPLRFLPTNGEYTEIEFEIEVAPGILWNGRLDGIARTWTKLRALVEHKTFTHKPPDDERWRNLQSSTYFRAIEMMGWKPVEAMCWNYIRSKEPTVPQELKDGTLSVKKIDTLPIVLDRALHGVEHQFKYEEFERSVVERLPDWFDRIITPISKTTVNEVFDQFVASAVEARDHHQDPPVMNIERHCSWCDYEPLCRARLQGNDFDFIKERQYEIDKGVHKKKKVRERSSRKKA